MLACACGPQLGTTDTTGGPSGDASGTPGSTGSTGGSTGFETSGADTSSALTDEPVETTGCEFICDDDPDLPPGDELCDIFNDECPEGQKCALVDTDDDGGWDSARCRELLGDGQHDEPCEASGVGLDTCGKGHVCWGVDDDGEGVCVAFCSGSAENPSCEPACTRCVISESSPPLCVNSCDPLGQGCPGEQVCIGDPNSAGFLCVLDASGGMAPAGTPCEFANVCNPGTMCASTDAAPHPDCQGAIGCCTPFCNYEQPDGACDALADELPDIECVPFSEEPAECAGPVGVCVVPA